MKQQSSVNNLRAMLKNSLRDTAFVISTLSGISLPGSLQEKYREVSLLYLDHAFTDQETNQSIKALCTLFLMVYRLWEAVPTDIPLGKNQIRQTEDLVSKLRLYTCGIKRKYRERQACTTSHTFSIESPIN